jgi:hypothetical protein
MEHPAKKQSAELSDDDYGAEISDILFGQPAWFIRHSASLIGVVFLLAIGASWIISYPTISEAPISFFNNSPLTGTASFPYSFASGLHPGESILVELDSSADGRVVEVYAEIESIALSPQASMADIRLKFPVRLSGQWTIRISKNDGRRLFFALFA